MKYGVNTMVWTTHVSERHSPLFSRIQEWGFDGIELFLSPSEPASIPAIRRILDEMHLELTTCSVLPREANLIDVDPKVRARGAEFLKQCIERTAELGGKLICGPLYAGLGVMSGRRRTEDEWKRGVEGLQVAARQAVKLGVTLCIEPLNRFETYFLNTLSDAANWSTMWASRMCWCISTPSMQTLKKSIRPIRFARWPRNSAMCIFPKTTEAFLARGIMIGQVFSKH